MEQVRKTKPTPTTENHEAQRMLNEAQTRQDKRARAAQAAGKNVVKNLDEVLDDIEAVLEEEGLNTEEAAYDMVSGFVQKGGQ